MIRPVWPATARRKAASGCSPLAAVGCGGLQQSDRTLNSFFFCDTPRSRYAQYAGTKCVYALVLAQGNRKNPHRLDKYFVIVLKGNRFATTLGPQLVRRGIYR